ncbi:alkane hydroxylase mah1 [Phtheirospermum japonicum]|uniref:Alkane hydroxylase mah1 n=1 Tax=Phtheirospermum japonicum TaxID=374723 RepID=A0A830CC08_9LAMI|nr:alkane hydroxylase mah1 [Phtheirospermum japonicum]
MVPAVIPNIHRVHDYITQVLNETGGTFEFKGPRLANLDMVFTCDPNNIHHIFSKRFSNYPKGPDFQKIFEVLGNNIFNSDFQLWELHRRATLSLMNDDNFYLTLEKTTMHKVRTGLLPILDHFFENHTIFDMQDILQRFAFDNICQFFLNHDPMSLQSDLPNVPCEKALGDALEPLFYRHLLPELVWKFQKWLNIGKEKKLMESWEAFDDFIYEHISSDRELNIFKSFNKAHEASGELGYSGDLTRFLRDTFLGLLFAGRDSLSVSLTWLLWLISTNPSVETKIRKDEGKNPRFFSVEECDKLFYLHAALCETLRLFPPIGLEIKAPAEHDVLPSGNSVRPNTRIVVSFYSTGRMESVWGKDCMEFKPERWLSPGGGIKHESSFKFPAFNVGPRTCPGKKMAFIEMKLVAAFIVHRYSVRVVESETVSPRNAIMLKADHGLRVRLSR